MASRHYQLMSDEDIKSMPLKSILHKEAFVFVWATCPKLDLAIDVIKSWGLYYRGVAHVWVKTNKSGNIIHAQGVPPTYSKPTTELLLVATTTKKGRPLKLLNSAIPQVVLESRQPQVHSAKPKIFHNLIEKALGDNYNRIEIFAREAYPGWDVIGNELDGEDITTVLRKISNNE
jgi:N6-adenosine-specific RNA methylase IME4